MPKTLLSANAPGDSNDDGYPFKELFDDVQAVMPGREFESRMKSAAGLILWGGQDISPTLYGEPLSRFSQADVSPSRRDLFEWTLIKAAVAYNVPIIGVCRGAQLLCAFDGGKLAQDVSGHNGGHDVVTSDGEQFWTAGSHHQMMLPRDNNTILATSFKQMHEGFYLDGNDAINTIPTGWLEPEAVLFPELNAIGIQWHPEWMQKDSDAVRWTIATIRDKLLTKETV